MSNTISQIDVITNNLNTFQSIFLICVKNAKVTHFHKQREYNTKMQHI